MNNATRYPLKGLKGTENVPFRILQPYLAALKGLKTLKVFCRYSIRARPHTNVGTGITLQTLQGLQAVARPFGSQPSRGSYSHG